MARRYTGKKGKTLVKKKKETKITKGGLVQNNWDSRGW